jgi:hypothetical protein
MTKSVAAALVDLLDGSQPCAQTDPELFFPEKGSNPRIAKQLCQHCPLIRPCLEVGLLYDVEGVWGGTSLKKRKRLRRAYGITAESLVTQPYLANVFALPPLSTLDDLED